MWTTASKNIYYFAYKKSLKVQCDYTDFWLSNCIKFTPMKWSKHIFQPFTSWSIVLICLVRKTKEGQDWITETTEISSLTPANRKTKQRNCCDKYEANFVVWAQHLFHQSSSSGRVDAGSTCMAQGSWGHIVLLHTYQSPPVWPPRTRMWISPFPVACPLLLRLRPFLVFL